MKPRQRRRIAVAMVIKGTVPDIVLQQWMGVLWGGGWGPGPPPFVQRHLYPVEGRNIVTYKALRRDDWDDLLMIDADHLINPRLRERLDELAGDQGVVIGPYYGRGWPFEIQAFEERPDSHGLYYVHPERWLPLLETARRHYQAGEPAPLLRVAGGGTGCMLIRRDVLERMEELKGVGRVWESVRVPDEVMAEIMATGGEERPGAVWSEDINFCLEVVDLLGEEIWLDTDLRLETGHVAVEPVGHMNYVAAHQLQVPEGSEVLLPGGYVAQTPEPGPALNRAQRRALAQR